MQNSPKILMIKLDFYVPLINAKVARLDKIIDLRIPNSLDCDNRLLLSHVRLEYMPDISTPRNQNGDI